MTGPMAGGLGIVLDIVSWLASTLGGNVLVGPIGTLLAAARLHYLKEDTNKWVLEKRKDGSPMFTPKDIQIELKQARRNMNSWILYTIPLIGPTWSRYYLRYQSR